MRALFLVFALVLVSCATGPSTPPASIAGTWSSWGPGHAPDPAGPETLVLRQSGTTVTGTASWAGNNDAVNGQYEIPNVRLELSPVSVGLGAAQIIVYMGQATHPDRMVLNGTTYYKQ